MHCFKSSSFRYFFRKSFFTVFFFLRSSSRNCYRRVFSVILPGDHSTIPLGFMCMGPPRIPPGGSLSKDALSGVFEDTLFRNSQRSSCSRRSMEESSVKQSLRKILQESLLDFKINLWRNHWRNPQRNSWKSLRGIPGGFPGRISG